MLCQWISTWLYHQGSVRLVCPLGGCISGRSSLTGQCCKDLQIAAVTAGTAFLPRTGSTGFILVPCSAAVICIVNSGDFCKSVPPALLECNFFPLLACCAGTAF